MTVNIFKIDKYPNRIAVSKIDSYVEGGAFFLDFGRQLIVSLRFFGVPPRLGVDQ